MKKRARRVSPCLIGMARIEHQHHVFLLLLSAMWLHQSATPGQKETKEIASGLLPVSFSLFVERISDWEVSNNKCKWITVWKFWLRIGSFLRKLNFVNFKSPHTANGHSKLPSLQSISLARNTLHKLRHCGCGITEIHFCIFHSKEQFQTTQRVRYTNTWANPATLADLSQRSSRYLCVCACVCSLPGPDPDPMDARLPVRWEVFRAKNIERHSSRTSQTTSGFAPSILYHSSMRIQTSCFCQPEMRFQQEIRHDFALIQIVPWEWVSDTQLAHPLLNILFQRGIGAFSFRFSETADLRQQKSQLTCWTVNN